MMPPSLSWVFDEAVQVKRFWKTSVLLGAVLIGGTWIVKDYLDSTQKSNLRSEATVLRTQLDSERSELGRTEHQLANRRAEATSLERKLATRSDQVTTLQRDLRAATDEVEALKTQLQGQRGDPGSTSTELEGAWTRLGLNPEKFQDLPLHWRQALAELAVAPRADFPALARFVRELRPDDIKLIDRVAPAIAHNGSIHFLVRSRTSPHRHPHLGLEFADFQRLREIGLLHHESSRTGVQVKPSDATPVSVWGSSVALAFYSLDGEATLEFDVETFTDVGAALVELLRVPSNLRYFAWVADTIRNSDLDVQLWAFTPSPALPEKIAPGMGRIEIVRL